MTTEELNSLFDKKFKGEVLPYIEKHLKRNEFAEPIYYYIDNFHLRTFRSALPIIIAENEGYNKELALIIGSASELIFYIALVQDDFIDRDKMRGDIESAYVKFGPERTIASSDYCYAGVYNILRELYGRVSEKSLLSIYENFNSAHRKLYRSFLSELIRSFDSTIKTHEVEQIHLDKTIQGTNSMYCAGIAFSDDPNSELAESLKSYSENLALAGQIKNDIYDITRYSKKRGFSDFKNGYINYLLVSLMRELRNPDKVVDMLKNKKYEEIVSLIEEKKIYELAQKKIDSLTKDVSVIINKLRFGPKTKDILLAWCEANKKIN